jgi:hypothetical protein
MPYSFTPPVETHRANNPADDLLSIAPENGKAKPLGATSISCNGTNLDSFEPATPAAQTAPAGLRHVLNSITATRFDFTSTIELPPAPAGTGIQEVPHGWISSAVPVTELNKIAAKINRDPQYAPYAVQLGMPVPNGKIVLQPMPTSLEMCGHILYHERQHAADCKWVIEKTFKPWVDWLDNLARGNVGITAADRETFNWFIGGGAQSIYYGRYIFELSKEVSDHYHASDEGAAPIFTAIRYLPARLSSTEVLLHVQMKAKLAAGVRAWDAQPHRCFRLYSVKDFAAGVSTEIITNGAMEVPDWTLPTIAINQAAVDDYERKNATAADSDEESAMANFF